MIEFLIGAGIGAAIALTPHITAAAEQYQHRNDPPLTVDDLDAANRIQYAESRARLEQNLAQIAPMRYTDGVKVIRNMTEKVYR